MTYEQARKDKEYLFNVHEDAYDMTGGFLDGDKLIVLMKNPTKRKAKEIYIDHIRYWFHAGMDMGMDESSMKWSEEAILDPEVHKICKRYDCEDYWIHFSEELTEVRK